MYKYVLTGTIGLSLAIASVSGASGGAEKGTLCHCPPDNPDECVTITVAAPGAAAHLRNHPDDLEGVCPPSVLWEAVIAVEGDPWLQEATVADGGTVVLLMNSLPYASTGIVLALNAWSGDLRWRKDGSSADRISVGEDQDRIFVGTHGVWVLADCDLYGQYYHECLRTCPSMLYGYDVETGEEVVARDSSVSFPYKIVGKENRLHILGGLAHEWSCGIGHGCPGFSGYRVAAHSTEDGVEQWSAALEGTWLLGLPTMTTDESGTTVFAAARSELDLSFRTHAYDAVTGSLLWSATMSAADVGAWHGELQLAVSPMGDRVFLNGPETLAAYDAYTGAELWQTDSPARPIVVSADGQVVVGGGATSSGLNTIDGSVIWTDENIGHVQEVVAAGTVVILAGNADDGSGVMVACVPETGETVWTVHSETVPRIVVADTENGRFYAVGSSPGGVSVRAYNLPCVP